MARFETPCQIVSLFVGAGMAAILIIMFLNAEVKKRNNEDLQLDVPDVRLSSDIINIEDDHSVSGLKFYQKVLNRITSSFWSSNDQNENAKVRKKRDTSDSDYYSSFVIEGEFEDNFQQQNYEENEKMYRSLEDTEIADISYTNSLQLSEAIMSSSIVGHKIRNIKEKLSSIGPNSQLVKAVLDLYCDSETVTYFMCYNTTSEDTKTNVALPAENIKNAKNYSESVMKFAEAFRSRNSVNETPSMNYDDGICDFHGVVILTTSVTVVVTSLANLMLFLLMKVLCDNSTKKLRDEMDKNLISDDAEAEDINYPIIKNGCSPYDCI